MPYGRQAFEQRTYQSAPLLKTLGAAKADRVILDSPPAYQQHVLIRLFQTAVQLVREIAIEARQQALCFSKGSFKSFALPCLDANLGHLENHRHSVYRTPNPLI